MAEEPCKGDVVFSTPDHPAYKVWHPYAKVMWQDENGFHSHELVYRDIVVKSEREATAYGFAVAHEWIDREL